MPLSEPVYQVKKSKFIVTIEGDFDFTPGEVKNCLRTGLQDLMQDANMQGTVNITVSAGKTLWEQLS